MLLVVRFSAAVEVSALSSVESETADLVKLPAVLWCCLGKLVCGLTLTSSSVSITSHHRSGSRTRLTSFLPSYSWTLRVKEEQANPNWVPSIHQLWKSTLDSSWP